jgi:hypothetical protein
MTDANEQAPKILDLPIGLDATGMRQLRSPAGGRSP